MKLYRSRVPAIAHGVLDRLVNEGDVEVGAEARSEAEQDLVAIMESYLKRDQELRESVRSEMERKNVPYDQYNRTRGDVASSWGHPTGNEVEKFLSRQFLENFMMSPNVAEVFGDDKEMFRKIIDTIKKFDVDENALRAEAEERIKNVAEGSVERQDALNRALREVRKKHGLL